MESHGTYLQVQLPALRSFSIHHDLLWRGADVASIARRRLDLEAGVRNEMAAHHRYVQAGRHRQRLHIRCMNAFYTPIHGRVEIRECNHIVTYDLGGYLCARSASIFGKLGDPRFTCWQLAVFPSFGSPTCEVFRANECSSPAFGDPRHRLPPREPRMPDATLTVSPLRQDEAPGVPLRDLGHADLYGIHVPLEHEEILDCVGGGVRGVCVLWARIVCRAGPAPHSPNPSDYDLEVRFIARGDKG